MKFRISSLLMLVIGILASGMAISSEFDTESDSPAQAQDSEEYYRFTDPRDVTAPAPGGIIPNLIRITDLILRNDSMKPPFSGNVSIRYTLPEPGLVTIRVVHAGTRELYLATILNSEFREAGPHEELWDGRDYYGKVLDSSRTPISYRIHAEALSAGAPPGGYNYVEYAEDQSQEDIVDKTGFKHHVHGWHEKKYEEIPLLRISKPLSGSVQKGMIRMLAAVDRERRAFGDKYGYGVRYYIDDQLIHEEFYTPESDGYFSYELDTTAYEDGEHLLYIGLCDHNDHVTSHGVQVVFNNFGDVSESGGAMGSDTP
jgi:hypothetical protein